MLLISVRSILGLWRKQFWFELSLKFQQSVAAQFYSSLRVCRVPLRGPRQQNLALLRFPHLLA
jgi:hypothetical protein